MITLDYQLSPSWTWKAREFDLRTTDAMRLHYDCFEGDVVFIVNGVDFSARWDWIPVLDFALALTAIAEALADKDDELFEFTDSGDEIEFHRDDEMVTIRASYAPGIATVPQGELAAATRRFVARVRTDLIARHPEFAENPFMAGPGGRMNPDDRGRS